MRANLPHLVPLTALAASLAPALCHAIVIRHDVPDSTYLNYGNQPQFSGVGQLIAIGSSGPLIGGGTLIRSNWVLTAAHVADNGPVDTMTFKVNGISYPAAEVIPWPDFDGDVSTGDIALVRLAANVHGVPNTNLFTGSDEVGRVGNLTGMGLTGTGLTGWGPYDAIRRAGQNKITIADSRFLYAPFDAPNTGDCLPMECGHALGDSGSGMFFNVNGEWQIAGINSWISDVNHNSKLMDYGDRLAVTRVSIFADWANGIIPAPAGAPALLAGLGLLAHRRRRAA